MVPLEKDHRKWRAAPPLPTIRAFFGMMAMRLTPCDCGVTWLVRMNRSFWMRLLPARRHYFCVRCRSAQLLSRAHLRRANPDMSPDLDQDVTSPAPLEDHVFRPGRMAGSRGR